MIGYVSRLLNIKEFGCPIYSYADDDKLEPRVRIEFSYVME